MQITAFIHELLYYSASGSGTIDDSDQWRKCSTKWYSTKWRAGPR